MHITFSPGGVLLRGVLSGGVLIALVVSWGLVWVRPVCAQEVLLCQLLPLDKIHGNLLQSLLQGIALGSTEHARKGVRLPP